MWDIVTRRSTSTYNNNFILDATYIHRNKTVITREILVIPIFIGFLGSSVTTLFHVPFTADAFSCVKQDCSGVEVVHAVPPQASKDFHIGFHDGTDKAIKDYQNGNETRSCPDDTDGTYYCFGYTQGYNREMGKLTANQQPDTF